MVLPEHKSTLLEQLQIAEWESVEDAYEVVTELLEGFAEEVESGAKPEPQLLPLFEHIQQACEGDSVIQVVDNILAIEAQSQWLDSAKHNLKTGSPITAHICYRQIRDYRYFAGGLLQA